jgi:hypothetical protein
MNLYRSLKAIKGTPEYWERQRLLSRLQGKIRYSEDDLNEVLKYLGRATEKNKGLEGITHKAIVSQSMTEKFRLLKKLNGFDFRASAALLSFYNPRVYAPVNPKSWNKLVRNHGFNALEKKKDPEFNIDEYRSYLDFLGQLTTEYGMSISDMEYALYMGDSQ